MRWALPTLSPSYETLREPFLQPGDCFVQQRVGLGEAEAGHPCFGIADVKRAHRDGGDPCRFDDFAAEIRVVALKADRADIDIDEIGAVAGRDGEAGRLQPTAQTVALG